MADIPYSSPTATSSFFDTSNLRNSIHASNIAVHNHFANMIFKGESDRLIYASSEFAFRARTIQQKSQDLNLPFMNYRIASGGIKNSVERKWFNHIANIRGIWVEELGRKIRYTPITLEYDSTIFVKKDIDAMAVTSGLFWDDSNETQLSPIVLIDEEEVALPGNLGYSLNPYSDYSESDWLKKNKMIAIQVNMTLETFLIKDNSNICIPTKILFGFAETMNIPETTYEGIIDHLNKTVDWSL